MAVPSIATIRTAIQDRLATLDDPLRAYDKMPESASAPRCVIVYPTPGPGGTWWLGAPAETAAARYNFTLELWIDLQRGLGKAQDTMDGYIAPAGSDDNSIEACLEDRTVGDDLDTESVSVKVDQFTRYGFGELNGVSGFLVATIPVEVFCSA